MKSIILNLRNTQDFAKTYSDIDYLYLNRVRNTGGSTITLMDYNVYDRYAITPVALADYPLTNLLSYSTTLEARSGNVIAGGNFNISGISFRMASDGLGSTANTIYANINKLNKQYTKKFITGTGNYDYFVALRLKALPTTVVGMLIFKNNNKVVIRTGTGVSLQERTIDYISNIQEGNLLVTSALLKCLGVGTVEAGAGSFAVGSTIVDIGIISQGISGQTNLDCSISNVFIGNSVDIFPAEEMEFVKKNLNKWDNSPRVGKTFLQKNESEKRCKLKIELMEAYESNFNMKNIYNANKDSPLAFFPFNTIIQGNHTPDTEAKLLADIEFGKQNLEVGGMYFISNDLALQNPNYDVYSVETELTEYK